MRLKKVSWSLVTSTLVVSREISVTVIPSTIWLGLSGIVALTANDFYFLPDFTERLSRLLQLLSNRLEDSTIKGTSTVPSLAFTEDQPLLKLPECPVASQQLNLIWTFQKDRYLDVDHWQNMSCHCTWHQWTIEHGHGYRSLELTCLALLFWKLKEDIDK